MAFRQARSVCFTINNEAKEFYELGKTLPLDPINYLVYQLEVAPDTGHVHVQGYVEFTKQMTMTAIRKLFNNNSLHMEARKGSNVQASDYCKKEESRMPDTEYVERGAMKEQGRRNDLEAVAQRIGEGAGLLAIADEHPMQIIRYYKGLQALDLMKGKKRNVEERPAVYYIYGPPGTGKSLWAHHKFPEAFMMSDTPQGWMDGYAGQDAVIIDEFRGQIPIFMMLKMLDFYPYLAPVKGSHVNFNAKKIIITSNEPPENFYAGTTGSGFDAWLRRVREFGQVINVEERPDIKEFAAEKKRKLLERADTFEQI